MKSRNNCIQMGYSKIHRCYFSVPYSHKVKKQQDWWHCNTQNNQPTVIMTGPCHVIYLQAHQNGKASIMNMKIENCSAETIVMWIKPLLFGLLFFLQLLKRHSKTPILFGGRNQNWNFEYNYPSGNCHWKKRLQYTEKAKPCTETLPN